MTTEPLTTTNLLAAATQYLEDGRYNRIQNVADSALTGANIRLFEDPYSLVVVVVYNTWADLSSGWTDTQAAFVELISRFISSSEAKAWEGYLVLLAPGPATPETEGEATRIRYDTHRVRKLVASGAELKTLADVQRVLLPLIPLEDHLQLTVQESVLDLLPSLLAKRGLPEAAVQRVIDSFRERQPLIEQLHSHLLGK